MRNWGLKGFDRSDRFGPGMRSAVKRFQKNRGLEASGVIGPKTWAQLERKR
jgi:peptidoglycan hydrolase-like protein with peptidoglycan-binding domain